MQGGELVGKIQEPLRDATATRVTICKPNGEELLSLPLTVGVLVGGLLTLAAIRAIGGLIAQFKLKIKRNAEVRTPEEEAKTDFTDQPA